MVVACGAARVFYRRYVQSPPPFSPSQSTPPSSFVVKGKSVLWKAISVAEAAPVAVSSAIAAVCGTDPDAAARYEARNDALRAIARERNLSSNDVAALVSWLASTNDVLRVERLAANLSLVRLTGDLQ